MRLYLLACPFLCLLITSCSSYSSQQLDKEDTLRIRRLGLLDEAEEIVIYTANFEKEVAGNFITTKRLAHYWIDERDSSKNSISSAYFRDIRQVDTVYNDLSLTQASYLTVKRKDSSTFNVYVSGSKKEVSDFFLKALNAWKNGLKE